MAPGLVIDVYFDLICPWCLIGKRHLDQALAEIRKIDPLRAITVRWHSVQLLPDVPPEGLDFTAFYVNRLGSAQAVRQRQAQVSDAAVRAGAEVDFARIPRMPNTRLAHQLLAFACTRLTSPQHTQLLERLLEAHFSRGENLGDRAALVGIAQGFGLPAAELLDWLDSGKGLPVPIEVPGVPFFVFDRQIALSGAQPPEALLAAIHQLTAPTV